MFNFGAPRKRKKISFLKPWAAIRKYLALPFSMLWPAAKNGKRKKIFRLTRGRPKIELLEERLAPAAYQFDMPLGAPFSGILQANAGQLQLIDTATHQVVKQDSISDVSSISITGSDNPSSLAIDMQSLLQSQLMGQLTSPISFNPDSQKSDFSADSLKLIDAAGLSATYIPGLALGASSLSLIHI